MYKQNLPSMKKRYMTFYKIRVKEKITLADRYEGWDGELEYKFAKMD